MEKSKFIFDINDDLKRMLKLAKKGENSENSIATICII